MLLPQSTISKEKSDPVNNANLKEIVVMAFSSLSTLTNSMLEVSKVRVGVGSGVITFYFFLFDEEAPSSEEPNLFFRADLKDSRVGLITTILSIRSQYTLKTQK